MAALPPAPDRRSEAVAWIALPLALIVGLGPRGPAAFTFWFWLALAAAAAAFIFRRPRTKENTMQTDDLGPVAATKPWYASKTILGSGVAVAAVVAGFFGVSIDEATKQVVIDQLEAILVAGGVLIGALTAIYGRFAAKTTIGPRA